ncbi:MAG: Methyltransferase type 11, partial [Actinomycetia bacterium]|nr:Methyltransferase type 11 [Actinomycetes bacterium]
MLTVDFTKFPINPGDRVLDLGCGAGRHAFEAYRRGARVVAADLDLKELAAVSGMFGALR